MSDVEKPLPACLSADARVVCFDGVCKVCGFWARFVHRNEPAGLLKLAALQSDEGQAIATWAGVPEGTMNTMIFIDRGRAYFKSSAALRAMRYLRFPMPLLGVLWIVPAFIRDFFYNRIALNRYSLFGKEESCMMPTPELKKRFLK